MATYKISYIISSSYSQQGDIYVENVIDEYDAIEVAMHDGRLSKSMEVKKVDLICE